MPRTTIPIDHILIEEDGSHIVVKAKINGKNARLLIDTGASRTVFDKERMSRFVQEKNFLLHNKLSTGLGTDNMETSTVQIKTFKLGELVIKDFTLVLLDLRHINGAYHKLGHDAIDGVLGNDILVDFEAVVDYRKLILTLNTK